MYASDSTSKVFHIMTSSKRVRLKVERFKRQDEYLSQYS